MYVEEKGGLRPVLKDFLVASFNGQIGHTDCNGEDLEQRVAIAPRASRRSLDFYDLETTTTRRETSGVKVGTDCVMTKRPPQVEKGILRYRNGSYEH